MQPFCYCPYMQYDNRSCFHRCVSVKFGGRGLPHLHPIIIPLVLYPFWGYSSTGFFPRPVSAPLLGRYPSPPLGEDRMGLPQPGQDGLPSRPISWSGEDGVPPHPRQDRMGTPPPPPPSRNSRRVP